MTKILVVDDEKDDCEELAFSLIRHGFQTESVTSGREAVDLGVWLRPDVLVTGCILGQLRGLKVAEALRLARSDMALVLTARFSSMDLAREARKLEAVAVLEKPFEMEHLVHAAEAAAAHPAKERPSTVAVIGIDPGGEIILANPKARRLLASAGNGWGVTRLQDVFGPGVRHILRRATEEWQEVSARDDPSRVWQIRARSTPEVTGYLAVLLEGDRFLAQPGEDRRYYSDEALVRLLLDLPAEHRPRWPFEAEQRALVIDGSDNFRDLAGAEIERANAVWHSTNSPCDALRMLVLDPGIRVVILDYQVLAADAGLVERLRARRSGKVVIVGQSLEDHRPAFAAQGVDRFVRKPWKLDELIRTLTEERVEYPARRIPEA